MGMTIKTARSPATGKPIAGSAIAEEIARQRTVLLAAYLLLAAAMVLIFWTRGELLDWMPE